MHSSTIRNESRSKPYRFPHHLRQRCLLFTFALLCCVVLAAPAQAQTTPGRREPITLQLRWKHQFQFAGYYAAQQQGFYGDAGLEVNIVEAQDGQNPIETVVNNEAQYGVGNSELVLWRSQGKKVVVLGVIFQHSPLVLLTTDDSGIDSLHDLIGRKVAIEANSAELMAYFNDEGISSDSLQIVEHPFSPEALLDGSVDATSAYSTDEPYLLQNAGVDYHIFSPRAAGIDFYGDVLFTTEDEISAHPERAQAFLDASVRGWKYAFDHEDELIDYIFNDLTQRHSREHLRFEAEQMRRLIQPDLIEPGYMYEGRWNGIIDTYARMGLIPTPFPVSDLLFQRQTEPDLSAISILAALVLGGVLVIGMVSLRFYRLNTLLRRQVAERGQAESRLRESEERYRSLVEAAPFPVVISWLDDGSLRYLNPRAETMLGLRSEKALGTEAVSYYDDPQDRERFVTIIRKTGQVHDFEVKLHTTSGQPFWALLSAITMTYEGQPAIFVTFKDMTERRWMELLLRESEELYRSILHASPDAVAITDVDGRIEMLSPAGLRLFGYAEAAEVTGQLLIDWIIPEHQQVAASQLFNILKGTNSGAKEYFMLHRDGTHFAVETKGELIRDGNDQPRRVVYIIRDITERKRAEAQSFALAVEQERVKLLASFIQDASHEFRTPLTIIGSSIFLLSKLTDEAKRQQHIEKAEKQIKRITNLVDMLMLMAKLDSGAPLRLAPTNLGVFVRQIAALVEPELVEKQLSFAYDIRSDALVVPLDIDQFQIAMRHLLENARRYSSVDARITLRVAERPHAAVIEVSDTGPGIDPGALPHIFERFWREDEAHTTPGFGLGLPLAQKIVTAHGGTIEVESTPGSGSMFRIVLPLDRLALPETT